MKTYPKQGKRPFCGYWNGSPVEIGLTDIIMVLPSSEGLHYHNFHEYYVVLSGEGLLISGNHKVSLSPDMVVMVEPREIHAVTWIHPDKGLQCLIVKQESLPQGKIVISDNASD